MKKLFFAMMAIVALFATSCQKETVVEGAPSKEATVSFNISTTEIATRYSEGTTATVLQYAVYDAQGNILDDLTETKGEIHGSTTVTLQLTTGNTYSVTFWAAAENAPYAVDFTTKTMTVDYATAKSNDESRDAFYAYHTFIVNGTQTEKIELKRPFAQLNIGTNDYDDSEKAGFVPTQSAVTVLVYKTLNFTDGTVADEETVTFTAANIDRTQTFPVAGYQYLAMNYLLVAKEKATVDVEFSYAEGTNVKTRTVGSVPVQRNYRTNIYGALLTSDVEINIEINPDFDPNTDINIDDNISNTHEYVDLGLSVLWATCNVGANSPEEYGDYFAWGETEPKDYYHWSTYKYVIFDNETSTINAMTKYSINDNKTTLDSDDDAATVNLGGNWRMPTKAEQEELINKCTWTWTTKNGVDGYLVTSNIQGYMDKSIFLPATGYIHKNTLEYEGIVSYYWSNMLNSTLHPEIWNFAHMLHVNRDFAPGTSSTNRDAGHPIRPVQNKTNIKKYTISVSSNDDSFGTVNGSGTYNENTTITITAEANSGYRFKEWNDDNTDNPRIITVTEDATYIAYFEAEQQFEPEYVDLGLSVKWATCNIGATKPEEFGDYFAWGEVEPKEVYNWSTYKHGKQTELIKYCDESYCGKNGFVDNKFYLDSEDDAAVINWGGNWRMPTRIEQEELINNCTWIWTTQKKVNGYKIIGPNGNSIFLPLSGFAEENKIKQINIFASYRSSSLASFSHGAYYIGLNPEGFDLCQPNRQLGGSIRAVHP